FALPQRVFRPPAIVAVRSARIPPEDPSLLVAQGIVADQEPPVLAVLAPHATLDLEGHLAGEPPEPLILQSGPVVWIVQRRIAPGVRAHELFSGEPGVVEHGPVHVQANAVRA